MTATGCAMCERVGAEGDLFIADLGVSRAYFYRWTLGKGARMTPRAGWRCR